MSDTTTGGWADRDSYLVSTAWLAERLDDPGVRIVDCRFYFDGRVGHEEYAKGHIPGAVHLYYSELSTKEDPIAFKMGRGPQMKQVMEAHGIGDDTLVVAYDDRLTTHTVDVSDRAAVEALVGEVTAAHGRVDGVANVAGIIQKFVPFAASCERENAIRDAMRDVLGKPKGDKIFAATDPAHEGDIVSTTKCKLWMKTSHLL